MRIPYQSSFLPSDWQGWSCLRISLTVLGLTTLALSGGCSKPAPPAPHYRIHIVLHGETLWAIAHRSGWSIDAIRRLNPWVNTVGIHPGDALKIPI